MSWQARMMGIAPDLYAVFVETEVCRKYEVNFLGVGQIDR
jgi:hypothetical protein